MSSDDEEELVHGGEMETTQTAAVHTIQTHDAQASRKKTKPNHVHEEAALKLKLKQLTNNKLDHQLDDQEWLETLALTAPLPLQVDDPDNDLEREMAFYNQALSAVRAAQGRMDRLGVPYRRPDDYFAEMTKSDAHMTRIKKRLIDEKQAIIDSEERRKQRTAKKFGKQVQTAKLQQRAQQRKREIDEMTRARKVAKGNQMAPEFDVGLEAGEEAPARPARGKGGPPSKRDAKDAKYGKKRGKDKRNTSESTFSTSFDSRSGSGSRGGKGGKGGKGGGKGKGKGGGGRGKGGRGGIAKRPGKEARGRGRGK